MDGILNDFPIFDVVVNHRVIVTYLSAKIIDLN